MRKAYLDLMTESDYRRMLAEHEAFQVSLGDVDVDTKEFGAGFNDYELDSAAQIDAEITRRAEARRGR